MGEVKYFHELTREQFDELCKTKMTWGELADIYSQPPWCEYPRALDGPMGCWSLVSQQITGEENCRRCDCNMHRKE